MMSSVSNRDHNSFFFTLTHVHFSTHEKAKATDETLTSENWEIILNLCDKVQDDGEQG
jgi:hypothetical protein